MPSSRRADPLLVCIDPVTFWTLECKALQITFLGETSGEFTDFTNNQPKPNQALVFHLRATQRADFSVPVLVLNCGVEMLIVKVSGSA